MQLENKTILVTGASSGIGKAAAHLFARQGARLVLGARRAPELSEIADEICKNGGKAVPLAGDVTDESYAQALVSLAQSEFGGLDGAFNNAGLMGEMGPVADMTTATWHTVLNTNLTSAFSRPGPRSRPCNRRAERFFSPLPSVGSAMAERREWPLTPPRRLG